MPRFTLSLRWTPQGLARVPSGDFLTVRATASQFAMRSLTIISITDRLVPAPLGPIWVVEGQESDVIRLVARFNGFGNVRAEYHRDFGDARASNADLNATIADLFAEPTRP